jgi:tetratricopeptide (TPR) repeat protein
MKTLTIIPVLIALLVLLVAQSVFANDGKYEEAMKKNISSVYSAQTVEELQQAVNAFERIGNAEKTKWEPYYFAAFGNIMMASREKDSAKKDQYLDLAMVAIEKAKSINAEESEIIAMEGFAYMIRVSVDPAARGPKFVGQAMQMFGKANALNPENPRPLALMAEMQYGTAQFFGSPTTEACGTATKALEKFESFKSENPLAPRWGKSMAERMKEKCK